MKSSNSHNPLVECPFCKELMDKKSLAEHVNHHHIPTLGGIEVHNSNLAQKLNKLMVDESGMLINPNLWQEEEHRKTRDERLGTVSLPKHAKVKHKNKSKKVELDNHSSVYRVGGNASDKTTSHGGKSPESIDDAYREKVEWLNSLFKKLKKANTSERGKYTKCPVCKARVKSASFDKHLAKSHPRAFRQTLFEKTDGRLNKLSKAIEDENSSEQVNLVKCPLCKHRTQYNVLFVHIQVGHPEVNPKIVMAKFNRVYKNNKPIEKDKYESELNELVKEYERLKQGQDESRDGGKYMGHMRRERGKFGSLPLYDDYSDESDAE